MDLCCAEQTLNAGPGIIYAICWFQAIVLNLLYRSDGRRLSSESQIREYVWLQLLLQCFIGHQRSLISSTVSWRPGPVHDREVLPGNKENKTDGTVLTNRSCRAWDEPELWRVCIKCWRILKIEPLPSSIWLYLTSLTCHEIEPRTILMTPAG